MLEPLTSDAGAGVFTLAQLKAAASSDARYYLRALTDDGVASSMTSVRACAYWADPSLATLTLHVNDNGTAYHIDVRFSERVETLCARAPGAKTISQPPKIVVSFGRLEEPPRVADYQV